LVGIIAEDCARGQLGTLPIKRKRAVLRPSHTSYVLAPERGKVRKPFEGFP